MFTYTSITVQRLETKMLPICSFQLLHELSTLFTCKYSIDTYVSLSFITVTSIGISKYGLKGYILFFEIIHCKA